jgi:hypothetical protein
MKRLHIHVSVDNLAESIRFYSGMFAHEPTVIKPDYAKWMLEDPRVNFAISQRGLKAGLNHLGIQAESAEELGEIQARLSGLQAPVLAQENAACCYAKSDKYWINDPSGIAWESFHTLDQIPVFGEPAKTEQSACCVPLAKTEDKAACCVPAAATGSKGACC